MGKKRARRADRPKKRRFTGNVYTRRQGEAGPSSTQTDLHMHQQQRQASASKTKLGPEIDFEFDDDDELSGFRFIDVKLLIDFVSTLLCPQCRRPLGENKEQSYVTEDRSSLASNLTFSCQCQHQPSFWTSSKCGRTYEVNRRFPLAMFAIGRNHTQGKRFLGNMNMPISMYKSSWSLHKKAILHATEETAGESTQKAAGELKASKGERVDVSCDGTWQRRGFQSKNGVFTVLSVDKNNSKVIDTVVMSNYCDACANNKKKRTAEDFTEWKQSHAPNCDKNHEGSAGSMEPAGAVTAFRRSEELHGLKYVSFLGDGDSKYFSSVSKAEPPIYDEDIAKLECCGHVQKRMGRQLTNKVAALKKETYRHNGKTVTGIGGKGGLTKKGILSIQGHYGAAIRNNVGDVQAMKRDIWAIWNHRNKTHTNCGVWCASKKDPPGDPNRNALPPFICQAIKPVFETLSSDTLISKCAHGGTQNTNESFHNLIWERCPKTGFVGRPRLTLAVCDATIAYNDGEMGRLSIFTKLGMPEGHYTTKCFRELDGTRIWAAAARLEPAQRRARRIASAQIAEGQEEFYQAGAHE